MSEIKKRVEEAQKNAITHSSTCHELIQSKGLKSAMEYCAAQGIEPPQCSLEAVSTNADKMRGLAVKMLSETKWWKRRLKNQACQAFEQEQRTNGSVTNFISRESLVHYRANKK